MSTGHRPPKTAMSTQSPGVGSEGDYHGILVQEGLREPSVLSAITILGRKTGTEWHLLRVGVGAEHLTSTMEQVQKSLKVEGGVPFYAHFYRPGELIVVFPDRVFHVTPDPDSWAPIIAHGKAHGIPPKQLDFAPCRFEDETY